MKDRKGILKLINSEVALEEDSYLLNDLADYARTSSFETITRALSRMAEIIRSQ